MLGHGIEDIYRLSPMQQGMLFHEMAEPGSGLYLLHRVYELDGPFQVDAFIDAWRRTMERHPVLRTSFHWKEVDQPVQVVHASVDLPVEREDWSTLGAEERRERARAFDQRQQRPFDLEGAPLMRIGLVRLGEERYRFTWTFHHALMEGWSAAIVMDEVLRDYAATVDGQQPQLEERRPFRDYLTWVGSQDLDQAESYWRNALEGIESPSTLLGEARLPTNDDTGGGWDHREFETRLSKETTAALRELGRASGVTLNTTVQAAWALLLSRFTDSERVLFGSTVSGRSADLQGVEEIVGLFINTIPTALRLDADQRVGDWLEEVQKSQVRARSFEWCSLVDIHGWSEIPRTVPLFESIVVFSNWLGSGASEWEGPPRVRAVQSVEGGTGYPLTVMVAPGEELVFTLGFDGRTTAEDEASRISRALSAILEDMAADPDKLVGEISMISAEDRQVVLARNETHREWTGPTLTHQLVFERAEAHPDDPAVSTANGVVTYGDLVRRARQLAGFLVERGVGVGDRVAVSMQRSEEVVVALLGVMSTGAAYVPIDPALPPERVSFMLDDAGVRHAVVDRAARDVISGEGVDVIDVEELAESIASASRLAADAIAVSPDDLAYVIYTSGSTGRPKGVAIEHHSLMNFLRSMELRPGFSADDSLLAVTTISFDISILEIFLPLVTGGRVAVATKREVGQAKRLRQAMEREKVTVMQATPATWRMLLDSGWAGSSDLKVLCGGEAFPRDLADRLVPICGSVWNMYGPTETTIWSAVGRVLAEDAGVPVGMPIDNTRIYVLDERMNVVPDMVRGELYIGGGGVARGYLNRPELTAERFVKDPFVTEGDARIYRTGDVARWLPDGRLDCLGRVDHQLKVRGFRIEPGEIEAVLVEAAGVRDAVVVASEFGPGDTRLVAYAVPGPDGEPMASELRAALRRRLPDYMIPNIFQFLDALPLNTSGKVDRGALPDPRGFATRVSSSSPPRTDAEKMLASVWQEVLGIDRVHVEDNFFDLGGHSLLAMQVTARLESREGIQINPMKLAFLNLGQFAAECDVGTRPAPGGA